MDTATFSLSVAGVFLAAFLVMCWLQMPDDDDFGGWA